MEKQTIPRRDIAAQNLLIALCLLAILFVLTAGLLAQPSPSLFRSTEAPQTSPVEAPPRSSLLSGWMLAAGYGAHYIRLLEPSRDNGFGLMLAKELLPENGDAVFQIGLRPAFTWLAPVVLIDAGISLRHASGFSALAGLGVDLAGESELRGSGHGSDFIYVLERDAFVKRLFPLLGLQFRRSAFLIELQYRIELSHGIQAYWTDADGLLRYPTGDRRHFILALLLGVALDW